jgi:hypothetical protein
MGFLHHHRHVHKRAHRPAWTFVAVSETALCPARLQSDPDNRQPVQSTRSTLTGGSTCSLCTASVTTDNPDSLQSSHIHPSFATTSIYPTEGVNRQHWPALVSNGEISSHGFVACNEGYSVMHFVCSVLSRPIEMRDKISRYSAIWTVPPSSPLHLRQYRTVQLHDSVTPLMNYCSAVILLLPSLRHLDTWTNSVDPDPCAIDVLFVHCPGRSRLLGVGAQSWTQLELRASPMASYGQSLFDPHAEFTSGKQAMSIKLENLAVCWYKFGWVKYMTHPWIWLENSISLVMVFTNCKWRFSKLDC